MSDDEILKNYNEILKKKLEEKEKIIFDLKIQERKLQEQILKIKNKSEKMVQKFSIENIINGNNINRADRNLSIYEKFLYEKVDECDLRALETFHNEKFAIFNKYFSTDINRKKIINLCNDYAKKIYKDFSYIDDFIRLLELFIEDIKIMRINIDLLIVVCLFFSNIEYINRTIKLILLIDVSALSDCEFLEDFLKTSTITDLKYQLLVLIGREQPEILNNISEEYLMSFIYDFHVLRDDLKNILLEQPFISVESKKFMRK